MYHEKGDETNAVTPNMHGHRENVQVANIYSKPACTSSIQPEALRLLRLDS